MLVIYMIKSTLTEYRIKNIGVVLRIYEWDWFYAVVKYEWGKER
jgi:hypothetical protein